MKIKIPNGKKTYIVAIATVCYALGGAVAGFVPVNEAIYLILGACGLSAVRHGIKDLLSYISPPEPIGPH
ncbi:unnamed protein product [marine sediment metagenome]|uniref:Holin n=1 Tax=marine sediment metagenome TaxID=412755 RepID=X1BJG9_9ZZZZ